MRLLSAVCSTVMYSMISPKELGRFEPFKQLSVAGRRLLAHGSITKSSNRSAPILHKGQPVSGAYVVLNGRLRVFTVSPKGVEATLYFIDPGDACILALNCLFNDLLYPAWVQAETSTTVAVIPGPVYRKLFATEPAIQNLTVQALSTLVYRLMTELDRVHSTNTQQRLAQFILLHADSGGVLRMTQQKIAQHLGSTREVIARLLRALVSRRLVKTGRGTLTIRDLFELRRLTTNTRDDSR
jgi:CRP/FNR family transcriptional regulator, anaerobic regulatory protein